MARISLTTPQAEFVTAPERFPALVAGFGAGKTHAGIWRAMRLKFNESITTNIAYYLPTYDLVARMGIPRIEEALDTIKRPYKTNRNDSLIDLGGYGQIIFRTMENPARIVAYEVGDSIVDELDTLPHEKAREVWTKIIARNRQKKDGGKPNTVAVTTTPEGFRFVYDRWKKNPTEHHRLIQASTYSNAMNLPEGYIDSLRADYPPNLLAAYLEGQFVNLTSGSVYAEFDRHKNGTDAKMHPSEPLHIGQDFNVGQMSSVVWVVRDGLPYAVDELTGILDTPALIATIKQRYVGHAIHVYPDASGANRRSANASESDIALLRQARFNVMNNPSNPAVKDRVNAMNLLICRTVEGEEERRMKVNADMCPGFVEALEKQAYDKNGEPDKTSGHDHLNDAAGYFVAYRYPVRARAMQTIRIGGI